MMRLLDHAYMDRPAIARWLCCHAGSVKITVLSKAPNSAALLLKTVSRPIKALKDCPQSPCVKSATAQTPSTAVTESGSRPASNPTVDAMSAFSMLYGASGVQSTPLGMIINPATALTVLSGTQELVGAVVTRRQLSS